LKNSVAKGQCEAWWDVRHDGGRDDTTGITQYLNSVSKYVVSSTVDDPGWEHTSVLRGPLSHEIQAQKSAPGHDMVTTGSITLT